MCTQQSENRLLHGSTTTESSQQCAFSEPNSVDEALKIPHWKEAMKNEFAALSKDKTWALVPYNSNQMIVDCK